MKAIMVMFDTLNRRMLPPYGCDWVKAPNFQRLAQRTVTFNNCYAGSLPCMPARREIHTGRYNFLHRGWGPLEPFDDSMPEILKHNGTYTHLVSDHFHYWEEGGCTYHTRYDSWECVRGQGGDPWKGEVADPAIPPRLASRDNNRCRQNWINRSYMQAEEDHHATRTFDLGIQFLEKNRTEDNWFLTIEAFDPHEPFFAPEKFKALYPHDYDGPHFDDPPYRPVEEPPEAVDHIRYEYAALVSMCDAQLGRVLDFMDRNEMWTDTMLIVNTDHGLLLSEHDLWGKGSRYPVYNEIAHIPFFIHDPRAAAGGERRQALVQTIDIAPTLLEYFGVAIPTDMQGVPLRATVADDTPVREAGLFGRFGLNVNVTDGRHVYMRAPVEADAPTCQYTLMPTDMAHTFPVEALQDIELAEPFAFTKGCRPIKVPSGPDGDFGRRVEAEEHRLFDLESDPLQQHPVQVGEIEDQMIDHLMRLMQETDAPREQYMRLGLAP
jgi:arylsulfatase A-like enzyme